MFKKIDFVTKRCVSFLTFLMLTAGVILPGCATQHKAQQKDDWISLFDGHSLDGWEASDKPGTFKVEDGKIVASGAESHLYYMGSVMDHDFKNFEFKAKVMTKPGSNSGIYFQTKYQAHGYPDNGFEVQINNSSGDWKRTGCLYDIEDFGKHYAKDNEWFTMYIKVQNKNVIVKVNDKQVIDWTQPEGFKPPKNHPGRYISSGTFALQEHDPKSVIYFKDIKVRPLPS